MILCNNLSKKITYHDNYQYCNIYQLNVNCIPLIGLFFHPVGRVIIKIYIILWTILLLLWKCGQIFIFMVMTVLQLLLATIVVIVQCIVIALSNDVFVHLTSILYITILYTYIYIYIRRYINCVRHNEKNEAELDENLIPIVMVILRAVQTYKKILQQDTK